MSNITLAIVLLGGCFLMHLFMVRKGGHSGNHGGDVEAGNKENKKDKHGGCCSSKSHD